MNKKRVNLTGVTFGALTVIKEVESIKNKNKTRRIWQCECLCGNIKNIGQDGLVSGDTNSCGCKIHKTLVGKRFGRLVVIEELPRKIYKDGTKHRYWKCLCDCGNTTSLYTSHLTIGRVVSCGCYRLEKVTGKKSSRYKGYEDIPGNFWYKIKQGAKVRDIEFNLNLEDAWSLLIKQDFKCALSGLDLIIPNPTHKENNTYKEGNLSLDRIDSTKGYTINNVQWVDKYINMAKRNLSNEKYIEICQHVVNHQKSLGNL